MSKPSTTTVSSCRAHIGRLCVACSVLVPLSPSFATTATPDPALRQSEQLDIRRLGRVSEDERSVLRVEWRAAATGADEARNVQDMLDSLRRMEGTVAEIGRLIRNAPAQKQGVAALATEAPDADDHAMSLALAACAAIGLSALWWLRRRNSAKPLQAKPILEALPAASPPVTATPMAALPPAPPSAPEP